MLDIKIHCPDFSSGNIMWEDSPNAIDPPSKPSPMKLCELLGIVYSIPIFGINYIGINSYWGIVYYVT